MTTISAPPVTWGLGIRRAHALLGKNACRREHETASAMQGHRLRPCRLLRNPALKQLCVEAALGL